MPVKWKWAMIRWLFTFPNLLSLRSGPQPWIYIFYMVQALPSAPSPHPHYLGNLHHCGSVWTLHSGKGTLLSSLPTTFPYAADTICCVYKRVQATPWGSVLRFNFLSIKISFMSCRFHNNARGDRPAGGRVMRCHDTAAGYPWPPWPPGPVRTRGLRKTRACSNHLSKPNLTPGCLNPSNCIWEHTGASRVEERPDREARSGWEGIYGGKGWHSPQSPILVSWDGFSIATAVPTTGKYALS